MFPGSAFSNGASQVPWNGAGCEAVPLLDHVHIHVCVHTYACVHAQILPLEPGLRLPESIKWS